MRQKFWLAKYNQIYFYLKFKFIDLTRLKKRFQFSAIVGSHEGEIGPNGEIFDPEIKSSMKLPWKVEIEGTEENMNRHDCEGTLISNKHVLTTASCALQGMAPMTLRAERNSSRYCGVELKKHKNSIKLFGIYFKTLKSVYNLIEFLQEIILFHRSLFFAY